MRLLVLAAAMAAIASPTAAQVLNPAPVSVIDRLVSDAVIAAAPPACPIPAKDTLTGSAGVLEKCMPRADASRPTVIQAKTTTTATDSTYTIAWDVPFASTPIYADARVYGSDQPYLCTVTTVSATGASGRCYQLVATTLPTVATALIGLTVSPFASAASGLSVRVVGRQ